MTRYQFKNIVVWLIVFIVGSLIVSFLINPSLFESFKSNITSTINSVLNKLTQNSKNTIEVIPSRIISNTPYSCYDIKLLEDRYDVSGIKKNTCKDACYDNKLPYSSYECRKDVLVCFCSNPNSP